MIEICIHHTRHLLHSLILSQKNQNKTFSKPTSSMALAEVGEPPDVTQTHAEAHAGEQVLGFVVPFGPVARLFYLHLLQLRMRGDPVVHARIREFQLHLHSSPFFRQLRWLQKWILAVSDLWEKAAVCFYFCECVRGGGCLSASSVNCLCPGPSVLLRVLGSGAELFTVTYGTSTAVISGSWQCCLNYVMSAILKKCSSLLKLLIHYTKQSRVNATPSSHSSPQQHHFPEIFVIYFWGSGAKSCDLNMDEMHILQKYFILCFSNRNTTNQCWFVEKNIQHWLSRVVVY